MAPQESETSINKLKSAGLLARIGRSSTPRCWLPFFEQILHQTQNVTTYTPRNWIVSRFNSCKQAAAGGSGDVGAMAANAGSVYNRLTDPKGKFEMAKAVFVFAVRLSDAANRSAARTFVIRRLGKS